MADKSSTMAKGGLLMGVAAVITAIVPLLTSDVGARADKADKKSELVLSLINQHLVFLGKQIDDLKADKRELRRAIRYMYTGEYEFGMGEGAADEIAPEPPPPPAPASMGLGGGGAMGSSSFDLDEPTLEEILEDTPPEPPIQKQAPLPAPEQLDDLLNEKK